MPVVQISLIRGKPRAYIQSIAEGVHRALHETYDVPLHDRFQFIQEYDAQNLIYDSRYLGIERSDDIVFVHVFAGKWRDTAKKKALYQRIVELLAQKPGLRPEDVQIILTSNDRDDWSFGKGIASYLKD
jgi:phenylpyruvate tautomerase PptA (4-oxalocrotonate tautomerase family)